MTRIIDFFLDLWDRLMSVLGFRRSPVRNIDGSYEERTALSRLLGLGRPLLALAVLLWLAYCTWAFSVLRGFDLNYPQAAMTEYSVSVASGEEVAPGGGSGDTKTCAPSRIVEMQVALLDQMVNRNEWVAANPVYKLGLFGVLDWEDTPLFDNKMSFQLGVLNMMRLTGIEMQDSLGRVRGTSSIDTDLQGAQSLLRVNERAWVFNNPFDPQLQTVTVAAGSSYRQAIGLYQRYNSRLAACDALFDARADNLFTLMNRIASVLGSMSERLAKRARGEEWDPRTHAFVPTEGDGNDAGWFDMRADNLFHLARGEMYALHGLMQGAKADFSQVIEQRNLADVWERMEAHAAEAAALEPLIVSNGSADGTVAPDHLSIMAAHVLRVRANLVEMRGILDR